MRIPVNLRHRAGYRAGTLFLLGLVAALGGCFPGYLRVTLEGNADVNQGRPLQMLVRTVDEAKYRGESHAEVETLVIRADASVLKGLLVEPRARYSRSFWIKVAKEKPVGFYFLYTSAAASWKLWLPPLLPWRIRIPLGRGGVESNGVRECRVLR